MSVTLLIVLAVLFLIVVVAAMVRKDDPFQAAATELGLKLTRTVPELLPNLDGSVDGLAVKIDIAGNREAAIRYEVFYPALGLSLRLERETTITRTLDQLGSTDPQVGSRPFDDSFRVNTSRPDALQTMMTPALRRQLIQLIEQYPNVAIRDGSISLVGGSREPPTETIVTTTRDLVSAAKSLVAARPPAPEPRQPLPMPASPQANRTPPSEVTKETATTPPAPPSTPESTPGSPEPTTMPPSPPAATATGLPPDFFEEVFGANRLSFEDEDRFEDEIRGTTVMLSGTVKQASPYAGDDELAPEAGTKAVITVAQIDNDLYGKTDIDAVVYLAETIAMERGDTFSFRGTIAKIDPFMRNVFIIDASRTA